MLAQDLAGQMSSYGSIRVGNLETIENDSWPVAPTFGSEQSEER